MDRFNGRPGPCAEIYHVPPPDKSSSHIRGSLQNLIHPRGHGSPLRYPLLWSLPLGEAIPEKVFLLPFLSEDIFSDPDHLSLPELRLSQPVVKAEKNRAK